MKNKLIYLTVLTALLVAFSVEGFAWELATVSGQNGYRIGLHCSIALSNRGLPYMAYYREYSGIYDARYSSPVGDDSNLTWTHTTIDPAAAGMNDDGRKSAIAVDQTNNTVHVMYYDSTGFYAYSNPWEYTTIILGGFNYPSIVIGGSNILDASINDMATDEFRYYYYNGTTWSTSVYINYGKKCVMLMDKNGSPHAVVLDNLNNLIHYKSNMSLQNSIPTTVASWLPEVGSKDVGEIFDLACAVDRNDVNHAHAAYITSGGELKYLSSIDNSGSIRRVATAGDYCAMALDENDSPVIVYKESGSSGRLMCATMKNNNPEDWDIEVIDYDQAGSGSYCSMVMDSSDGDMHVAYYCNGMLKYARRPGNALRDKLINNAYSNQLSIYPVSGKISVTVSSNTFSGDTRRSLVYSRDPGVQYPSNSGDIRLTPIGFELSTSGFQPGKPIKLSVEYRDTDISSTDSNSIAEGSLKIMRYENGTWVALPSIVFAEDNRVEAYTSHLSMFALAGVSSNSSPKNAYAYPSPFYISRRTSAGGMPEMNFVNIPPNAKINIYSIDGTLIYSGNADTYGNVTPWRGQIGKDGDTCEYRHVHCGSGQQ